jgi:hypothetical protein
MRETPQKWSTVKLVRYFPESFRENGRLRERLDSVPLLVQTTNGEEEFMDESRSRETAGAVPIAPMVQKRTAPKV